MTPTSTPSLSAASDSSFDFSEARAPLFESGFEQIASASSASNFAVRAPTYGGQGERLASPSVAVDPSRSLPDYTRHGYISDLARPRNAAPLFASSTFRGGFGKAAGLAKSFWQLFRKRWEPFEASPHGSSANVPRPHGSRPRAVRFSR